MSASAGSALPRVPDPATRASGDPGTGSVTPADTAFTETLRRHGLPPMRRARVTTLQVNVGKLCNQACHHCHVDAGPHRREIMSPRVAGRVLEVLAASPGIECVDITGGAPELCLSFRDLVRGARGLGLRVIDRCNLTVLLEPGQEDLAEFLAEHEVAIVASLPCYLEENVDRQRGGGVFLRSLRALRRLNDLGYGQRASPLGLDLVYNPVGAHLPPGQAALEAEYREQLMARHGIAFHQLLTITNMPIARFAQDLRRRGREAAYMSLLVNHFNPQTVPGLMCRSLVSVGHDGRLYDCDFNQMLELPVGEGPASLFEIGSLATLDQGRISTGPHCHGCTAGAGSSCGGAIA